MQNLEWMGICFVLTCAVGYLSCAVARLRNRERKSAKTMAGLRETQALWEQVIHAMPVMFFVKDASDDFRYILCNPAFAMFVGKLPQEVTGKTDMEIFADRQEACGYAKKDRLIMEEGRRKESVEELTDASGRIHHLQTIKQPFKGENGRELLLGVGMDVTRIHEPTQYEKNVNLCREMLFAPTDSAKAIHEVLRIVAEYLKATHVYILRMDDSGKRSRPVAEYTGEGYSPLFGEISETPFFLGEQKIVEEVLQGKPVQLDGLQNHSSDPAAQSVEKIYPGHKINSLFLNGKHWGNLGVACENRPVRIFSESDERFLKSVTDMLELLLKREQTSNDLKQAIEMTQSAERAKSVFLASMSHEIRTPLNAVIGFSELLRDETLSPAEQKEYLKGIFSSGNALLSLINDVLDLSKVEAGQLNLTPEKIVFYSLAEEMKCVFLQKCTAKGLAFQLDIPEDFPVILMDKLRLRQLLFNLIGNAVKFTEKGHVTVKARFTKTTEEKGTFTLHVLDTGMGIAARDQKRLFQMFVQTEAVRRMCMPNSGTGLGLALCRRLVERMEGKITLESEPGKGSDFSVTFPDIPLVPFREDGLLQTGKDAVSLAAHEILLVDDVSINLKVMDAMLRKLGYSPVLANGPEEALAALEKHPFDMIFTDLWMPNMDGAVMARTIRASRKQDGVKIIAITADIDSRKNFDMSVFDETMAKPVTMEKFRTFLMLNNASEQGHPVSKENV